MLTRPAVPGDWVFITTTHDETCHSRGPYKVYEYNKDFCIDIKGTGGYKYTAFKCFTSQKWFTFAVPPNNEWFETEGQI